MSERTADRNLLFGVLAWQAGVLTESQLLAAMQAWTFVKGKSLAEILVEQSVLTDSQREKLEPMVQAHIELHHDNVGQALQSLTSVPGVTMSLRKRVTDDDVQASLNHFDLTVARDSSDGGGQRLDSTVLRPPPPGQSRFQIIRPHARGGLGEVFVAEDQELNREVALKEIQSRFADQQDSRNRFVLEAEITGGLEHPGIVPVYGLGKYDDGRPYYAMRFIKGDSLKDAIKEFHETQSLKNPTRSLRLRKLLGRFVDVCQAISYAHSRGVLHRDLKPGNIMLGKYGETLVVDWGLAKVAGRDDLLKAGDEQTLQPSSGSGVTPTVMGRAIGTPAYMPPEQAAGRLDELGPASDVYSLGATLYHLLTGASPFEGKDLVSTLKGVKDGGFTPPREVNSDIHPAIESVCLKAMSLKPADRYASPEDLANDVEQFLADEPVSAMSEPLFVKAGRWVRKHQTLTATTAAAVLVAIAGMGLFQKYRSDRAAADLIVQTRNAEEQERLTGEARDAAENERRAKIEVVKERNKAEDTLARNQFLMANLNWESDRVEAALENLYQVPQEDRKFAWHLTANQFKGSDITIKVSKPDISRTRFCANDRRILVETNGGFVCIVDPENDRELFRGKCRDLRLSPDRSTIAFRSAQGNITVINCDSGKVVAEKAGSFFQFARKDATLWVHQNNNLIAIGLGNGALKSTIPCKLKSVSGLATSLDGNQLAVVDLEEGVLEFLRKDAQSPSKVINLGHDVRSLKKAFDAWLARIKTEEQEPRDTIFATKAFFSEDGTKLVTTLFNEVKVWDTSNVGICNTIRLEEAAIIERVFFSNDPNLIAVDHGYTLHLLDFVRNKTHELYGRIFDREGLIIHDNKGVSFSPDVKHGCRFWRLLE